MPHRLSFAAPETGRLIDWPASFGRRFAIFVDVEEEFDWSAPFSPRAASVTAVAALPAMHRRFHDAGIACTYLVDHPIATDPRAIDLIGRMLGDSGTAIGTQLHPWVNPPFHDGLSAIDSFAGNLPRHIEAAKLDILTDAIEAGFGHRPIVYRAGRYGLGPNSLDLLATRGYRIDTSMRSRHDYRATGGPDYRAIGPDAFRTGPDGALIELPLTTIYTGRAGRAGPVLHPLLGHIPFARGAAARLGLVSRVPLTPEGTPAAEAVAAIRIGLAQGVRLFNLSYHSPSLVPGNTPYVRDAADLARFDRWWDVVLDTFAAHGVRPASLDEIAAAA